MSHSRVVDVRIKHTPAEDSGALAPHARAVITPAGMHESECHDRIAEGGVRFWKYGRLRFTRDSEEIHDVDQSAAVRSDTGLSCTRTVTERLLLDLNELEMCIYSRNTCRNFVNQL